MRSFVAAFLVAALVATASTPMVRQLALRVGAVSNPGGRHVHERSVPRLGGLSLALAFFAPLIGLFFVESAVSELFTRDVARVAGLFAGGAAMVGLGALDDVRGVRALYKLYVQAAAHGLTLFDLSAARAAQDLEQWQPLLDWAEAGDG